MIRILRAESAEVIQIIVDLPRFMFRTVTLMMLMEREEMGS